VLADGRQVRASEDEHLDLFWALRGGGGDFAAVTTFWFRAHRVGPIVLGGMLLHPFEQAGEALRATRALMEDAPDELTIFAALITAPPHEPFPPELQGKRALAVAMAWSGDVAAGERVIAQLRRSPAPAATPSRGARCATPRCASTCVRSTSSTSTLLGGLSASAAARCCTRSTRRRRSMGSPSRPGRSRTPASAGSRSAAAWAGSCAATA